MVDSFGSFPIFPVAETRFGRMFTLRGDTVIAQSLRLYGEFAGDEVDSILSLVRPADHVLDIGANIGFHSLGLARRVGPSGVVIAFEPQRYCFQLLCANVTANQLAQVQCHRAAVGDTSGVCAIPLIDPAARHNSGATAVANATLDGAKTETVPMIAIDDLELPRCDLVKIDTEGFEDRVLVGLRQTLARHLPVLYVEVHDSDKLRRATQILKPLGYQLFLHHTQFFRPANPSGAPVSIFGPTAGGSALIALPPGRDLPQGLPGKMQGIG